MLFLPSAQAVSKAHYLELAHKLDERVKQKDWQGARDVLVEIGKELPAPTPRYMLIVASVEAHLGHKAEALQWLQKYAAMGLSYDLTRDDDLKALLSEEAGQKLVAEMKQTSQPIEKAEFLCTLPQADTMPEDIAYLKSSDTKSADSKSSSSQSSDSKSGPSFIVSSIQHRTLYRVSLPKADGNSSNNKKECTMQELPLPEEAKRWPTMAVSAAPDGKILWMTANAMPGFGGFPKEDEGKAALFQIDAQSGKVLHRYDLAENYPASRPAVLGDMQVAQDGTVYVTDSIGGGVYRLRGNPQLAKRGNTQSTKDQLAKLEKIADGLFSPQTPALSRDGKRLFVADYSMGVAVIDLTSPGITTKLHYLPHPENVAVTGLDGLYLSGDSLIGIQNGTKPNRILRMKLNAAQTEITSAEVIEQATERMGDPTHAILVDGWFYVSANVGWSKVEDNGKLRDGEKFTPPALLRFPAPGRTGK